MTTAILPQGTEQAGLVSRVLDPSLGNTVCVDCGAPGPEWVSLNLGVVMCITCSAAHRAMGSHVSQVKRTPDIAKLCCQNNIARRQSD